MKALVVGSGLGVVVAAAVLAWMLVGGVPEEEIYPGMRLSSPNGAYVVSFFGTGGGGAAGWSNQHVGVALASDPFDPDRRVLTMRRGYEVCLRWVRDDALLVQYPDGATIELKQGTGDLSSRVDIEFEAVDSEGGWLRSDCTGTIAELHGVDGAWDVRE